MRQLIVLFDSSCELCQRARRWLASEPAYVPLEFVAAQSAEARERFPTLDHSRTLEQLTVIADDRQVYRGERAWVMCLWALKRYRSNALFFSSTIGLAFAKDFVSLVSRNRHAASRWLRKLSKKKPA